MQLQSKNFVTQYLMYRLLEIIDILLRLFFSSAQQSFAL